MEALIPSRLGIFVYRLFTSIAINIKSFGNVSLSLKIRLRKFVESLTLDCMYCISGFR